MLAPVPCAVGLPFTKSDALVEFEIDALSVLGPPDKDAVPLGLNGIEVFEIDKGGNDERDTELVTVVFIDTVGSVSVNVPPLAVIGNVVTPGTWRDKVVLANGALLLLTKDEVCRAVVVDVRLPVACILVKTVAFPVVSEDEDEDERVLLEVGRKGVTVRLAVTLEYWDCVPADPVGPVKEVALVVGKGGLESAGADPDMDPVPVTDTEAVLPSVRDDAVPGDVSAKEALFSVDMVDREAETEPSPEDTIEVEVSLDCEDPGRGLPVDISKVDGEGCCVIRPVEVVWFEDGNGAVIDMESLAAVTGRPPELGDVDLEVELL